MDCALLQIHDDRANHGKEASGGSRNWQVLRLSANTESALAQLNNRLGNYLKQHREVSLADVAYTLDVGGKELDYRQVFVCSDSEEAVKVLEAGDPRRVRSGRCAFRDSSVVFMFPGGGAQYPRMGAGLYDHEPEFRKQMDCCAEILEPPLGIQLCEVLYRHKGHSDALRRPSLALPALFATEYALAKLWMCWGVEPEAMIGHSLGEYVAACLAGVFSLEDALELVAYRGKLFERVGAGAMLSVFLPPEEVQGLLTDVLSLAAINAPSLCVLSGSCEKIDELEQLLANREVDCRRVQIGVPAHSSALDPVLQDFLRFVARLHLRPPSIPFISNLTGSWIRGAEAADANYWACHLRQTVRFAEGIQELLGVKNRILLEVGPGRTLSSLARLQAPDATQCVVASMRHAKEQGSDAEVLLQAVGQLWLAGRGVNPSGFYAHELRRRIPLPV